GSTPWQSGQGMRASDQPVTTTRRSRKRHQARWPFVRAGGRYGPKRRAVLLGIAGSPDGHSLPRRRQPLNELLPLAVAALAALSLHCGYTLDGGASRARVMVWQACLPGQTVIRRPSASQVVPSPRPDGRVDSAEGPAVGAGIWEVASSQGTGAWLMTAK